VVQLSVLDWFVDVGLEVSAEITIFHINNCLSDKVVTEKQVVVPKLNLQKWAAWENSLELKLFIDFWIRLV
jgi:hypothetical protein